MNRITQYPSRRAYPRQSAGTALLFSVAFAIATFASPAAAIRIAAGQFHSFLIK